MKRHHFILGMLFAIFIEAEAFAQTPPSWNQEQQPFQIYGNTYYVGTKGLSSILITSKDGHILIDGALPESARMIATHVRSLGFRIEDVKLILNTHVHFDHAGGIAELQQLSGAKVAASVGSVKVLQTGEVDPNDPQFGQLPKIPPIANVQIVKDGETLQAGALTITAHYTPGHTAGGTSWSWQSCEQSHCVNVVYADSLNPISAKGFRYSDPKRKPNSATQMRHSFEVLSALPCDILLTPHPELSDMLEKVARKDGTAANPFIDANACRNYAQSGRDKLAKRVAEETTTAQK